ncbi:MAG: molybdopterin converting factor subunit 1 [Magnetococcales bacterium]|nr:molybdopterin converting factor subunit 1 [Magnetococcales bacterium]
MIRLLFFARVRERMGQGRMELPLPPDVATVAALLTHLRGLGEPFAAALAGDHLQVAVNQVHARAADPVGDGDEIAIFPPVSGG